MTTATRIDRMTQSLAALQPSGLTITDDSARHAGHAAMKGITGDHTHLQVEIASPQFEGKSRVQCHRMVQKLCQPEFAQGLHALQINITGPR